MADLGHDVYENWRWSDFSPHSLLVAWSCDEGNNFAIFNDSDHHLVACGAGTNLCRHRMRNRSLNIPVKLDKNMTAFIVKSCRKLTTCYAIVRWNCRQRCQKWIHWNAINFKKKESSNFWESTSRPMLMFFIYISSWDGRNDYINCVGLESQSRLFPVGWSAIGSELSPTLTKTLTIKPYMSDICGYFSNYFVNETRMNRRTNAT